MSDEKLEDGEAAKAPLRNLWYFAALSRDLLRGDLKRIDLLGLPIVVGRTNDRKIFALYDICPHRAAPLSAGKILPSGRLQCPYHGWEFDKDGACRHIPSLISAESAAKNPKLHPDNLSDFSRNVRSFTAKERDGLIWVYMGAAGGNEGDPPSVESKKGKSDGARWDDAKPRWVESQTFNCGIDEAVIGLMDPAHGPYVHGRRWWWKMKPRAKTKLYAPYKNGFIMQRTEPARGAYKILAWLALGHSVQTEIAFDLPSTRFENIHLKTIWGSRVKIVGLTACTPIDSQRTQVTQVFYWPGFLFFLPGFLIGAAILSRLGPIFLADDRRMVELQRDGLRGRQLSYENLPPADRPATWYLELKREWMELGRGNFKNPMCKKTEEELTLTYES